jgi:hypothetical protein
MKIITLTITLLLFIQVCANPIGEIIGVHSVNYEISEISMTYEYKKTGKLVITLENICLNSAAKAVTGTLLIKGDLITISPKEIYPKHGPFDSVKTFNIKYVISDVPKRVYKLVHDDSSAEGVDRVFTAILDLTRSPKGCVKVYYYQNKRAQYELELGMDSEDPFADSIEQKVGEQDAASKSQGLE